MLSGDLLRNLTKSLLHKEFAAAALFVGRTRIKIGVWNTSWRRLHRSAVAADHSRPLIAVTGVCQQTYAETILQTESGGWKIFTQGAAWPVEFIKAPKS